MNISILLEIGVQLGGVRGFGRKAKKKKTHFRLHGTIQIYMPFKLKTNSNNNIQVGKKNK